MAFPRRISDKAEFFENSFFRDLPVNPLSQVQNLSISQIHSTLNASGLNVSGMISQNDGLIEASPKPCKSQAKQMDSSNQILPSFSLNDSDSSNVLQAEFTNEEHAILESEGYFEQTHQKDNNIKEQLYFLSHLLSCPIHSESIVQNTLSYSSILNIHISHLFSNSINCPSKICSEICSKRLKLSEFTFGTYLALKLALVKKYQNLRTVLIRMPIKNDILTQEQVLRQLALKNEDSLVVLNGQFERPTNESSNSHIAYNPTTRQYILAYEYQFWVEASDSPVSLKVFTLDNAIQQSIPFGQAVQILGFKTQIADSAIIKTALKLNSISVINNNNQPSGAVNNPNNSHNALVIRQLEDLHQSNELGGFDILVMNFLKTTLPANVLAKAVLLLSLIAEPAMINDVNIMFLSDQALSMADFVVFLRKINKSYVHIISDKTKLKKQEKGPSSAPLSTISRRIILGCHTKSNTNMNSILEGQRSEGINDSQSYLNILFSETRSSMYSCSMTLLDNLSPFPSQTFEKLQLVCRIQDSCDEQFLEHKIGKRGSRSLRRKDRNTHSQSQFFEDSISSRIKTRGELSESLDDQFFLSLFTAVSALPTPILSREIQEEIHKYYAELAREKSFPENIHPITQNPRIVLLIISLAKARAKIDLSLQVLPSHLQDVLGLIEECLLEVLPEKSLNGSTRFSIQPKKTGGVQKKTLQFLQFIAAKGTVFTRKGLRELYDECGIEITGCFDDFIDSLSENDYFARISPTHFQINNEKL